MGRCCARGRALPSGDGAPRRWPVRRSCRRRSAAWDGRIARARPSCADGARVGRPPADRDRRRWPPRRSWCSSAVGGAGAVAAASAARRSAVDGRRSARRAGIQGEPGGGVDQRSRRVHDGAAPRPTRCRRSSPRSPTPMPIAALQTTGAGTGAGARPSRVRHRPGSPLRGGRARRTTASGRLPEAPPRPRSKITAVGTIGTTSSAPGPTRHAEPAPLELRHHAVGRGEAVGAAAGEADGVHPVDEVRGSSSVGLARAGPAAAHVDRRRPPRRAPARRWCPSASRRPVRSVVADAEAGHVGDRADAERVAPSTVRSAAGIPATLAGCRAGAGRSIASGPCSTGPTCPTRSGSAAGRRGQARRRRAGAPGVGDGDGVGGDRARHRPRPAVRRVRPGQRDLLPDQHDLQRALHPHRRRHDDRPARDAVGRHGARARSASPTRWCASATGASSARGAASSATSRSTSATTCGPATTSTSPTRTTATRTSTCPISRQSQPERPVIIGDGSWLGHGTVVLPGARIGRHVVIGAEQRGDRRDPRLLASRWARRPA